MLPKPFRLPPTETDRQASGAIIWLIGFFAFVNVYSVQSILPLIVSDFGASPVEAGATVGATVFAVALVSPFIGMLSDAFGRKGLLCASFLALALPTALIPLADTLHTLIVLRFLQGLFTPGIVVVLLAYLGEEFRSDAVPRMTTVYMSGAVMGGFCGRFMTGYGAHFFGWRSAFAIEAAMIFCAALFALWQLPASRHFTPNRDIGGAFRMLGRHLRNPQLRSACAVGFCVLFSLVGAFTYVNLMLALPPFSLSVAALANIFCVYLVGVFVTPISGRFIVRFGYRNALLAALAISMTGVFTTLAPSLTLVIAGLAICSSGVFVCQSATISFVADRVREGRSLANGLYNMSYYAGGAAGSWLAGLAYERWQWSGTVFSIALVQMLAGILAWTGWRNRPRAA